MTISELEDIIQRVVDRQTGAVVDIGAVTRLVMSELPPWLRARVNRHQIRDRVFIVATRKAARSETLATAG